MPQKGGNPMKFKPGTIVGLILLAAMLLSSCSQGLNATQTPTLTATSVFTLTLIINPPPTLTPEPTETSIPMLSENPTADELFAAKEGQIPDHFTYGGHEWTVKDNVNNERIWTREDGKVNLEWVHLYGDHLNAYMFVTRSEPADGKRTLEIYTDPRYPIFDVITGSGSAIDQLIGTSIANKMDSDAAQSVVQQTGSTLKIIIGGDDNFPMGSNSGRPQTI